MEEYPIRCLKNIVPVEGNDDEIIPILENYAKEQLIQCYNHEENLQLKFKIAHALGICSSFHYFFIVLSDPNLCDKRRNDVRKEIIGRIIGLWQKNHKMININNLRDILKNIYERSNETSKRPKKIFQQLLRLRILN